LVIYDGYRLREIVQIVAIHGFAVVIHK
jgi:hypothetical protein